jgi:hypothetical protein
VSRCPGQRRGGHHQRSSYSRVPRGPSRADFNAERLRTSNAGDLAGEAPTSARAGAEGPRCASVRAPDVAADPDGDGVSARVPHNRVSGSCGARSARPGLVRFACAVADALTSGAAGPLRMNAARLTQPASGIGGTHRLPAGVQGLGRLSSIRFLESWMKKRALGMPHTRHTADPPGVSGRWTRHLPPVDPGRRTGVPGPRLRGPGVGPLRCAQAPKAPDPTSLDSL